MELDVTRSSPRSLSEQIRLGIGAAIREGRLAPGARLPSWRDLAVQLGVARGTVRVAYERLVDEQLIVALGPAGTFVEDRLPALPAVVPAPPSVRMLAPRIPIEFDTPPRPFQVAVPAHDAFPVAQWSRIAARATRAVAERGVFNADPRGEPALRREIAAHLSIARGLRCTAEQIFITSGYAGGLGMALRALQLRTSTVWTEDPGYPFTREGLRIAGLSPVPVRVDEEGMVVQEALATEPTASLAVVTAAQQSPLGVSLSLTRRRELLSWAESADGWIIDDDYLSELQLTGRAAPALASLDQRGRVLHVGTFSKTINPALRLGFIVVPTALVDRFDTMTSLSPASGANTQIAVAEFMRDGHFLRHLRRMKRLYLRRREAVESSLGQRFPLTRLAGPMMLLQLPAGVDDVEVASRAWAAGFGVAPYSPWFHDERNCQRGLVFGVANTPAEAVAKLAGDLAQVIELSLHGPLGSAP